MCGTFIIFLPLPVDQSVRIISQGERNYSVSFAIAHREKAIVIINEDILVARIVSDYRIFIVFSAIN